MTKRHNLLIVVSAIFLAAAVSACSFLGEAASDSSAKDSAGPEAAFTEEKETSQKENTNKGPAQSIRLESAGFDLPEQAVVAYLAGLKSADLNAMMRTFAVESYVEHYDFEANLNRIRVYNPAQEIKMPNVGEVATDLNMESRRSTISDAISRQYIFLCGPDIGQPNLPRMESDEDAGEFTAKFVKSLNEKDLSSVTCLGFIAPAALSEGYDAERTQEIISEQAAVYGAKKVESCVAVFELEGETYLLCCDVVQYNGKWHMLRLGGTIASLLSVPVTSSGIMPVGTQDKADLLELISEYMQPEQLDAYINEYMP